MARKLPPALRANADRLKRGEALPSAKKKSSTAAKAATKKAESVQRPKIRSKKKV